MYSYAYTYKDLRYTLMYELNLKTKFKNKFPLFSHMKTHISFTSFEQNKHFSPR